MRQPRLLETEEDRLEKVRVKIARADEILACYLLDIAEARKERRELRREIEQLTARRDALALQQA